MHLCSIQYKSLNYGQFLCIYKINTIITLLLLDFKLVKKKKIYNILFDEKH